MGLRLQSIERLHLGLLAVAVCAAYATGWLAPLSLLLGGAVMGANVWLMRQLAARLFTSKRQRPWFVLAAMLGKFSLFVGLLTALFWRVPLDPLAFGFGATLLLVACVIAALRRPPVLAAS
jgi:ABC-type Mn2+/Zn2+ transport system permease subunit